MKGRELKKNPHATLLEHLSKKSILICCGLGGVGKTTLSISLALELAKLGKKICLITVDPAKRLASAMNLDTLGTSPQNLDSHVTAHMDAASKETFGSFSALMFHGPASLDNFVLREKGENFLSKLKENRLYQILTDNLSGIHEYFVVEKIHELNEAKQYDIIITDTPPSRHTLDFLEAPSKIDQFLKNKILQWLFVKREKLSFLQRLKMKGKNASLSILKKVIGNGVLSDLVELSSGLYELNQSFRVRQKKALKLLRSRKTEAILISTPQNISSWEFEKFYNDIHKQKIEAGKIVINRSLLHLCPMPLKNIVHNKNNQDLRSAYKKIYQLVEQEKQNYKNLQQARVDRISFYIVPEKTKDIHNMASLEDLNTGWRYLGDDIQ